MLQAYDRKPVSTHQLYSQILGYCMIYWNLCQLCSCKEGLPNLNKRTRLVIEAIHVDFDELTAMASEQFSSRPEPELLNPVTIRSGLVPNPPSPTPYVPPTNNDWEILFQPVFDEHLNPPPSVASLVPAVIALEPTDSTGSPSSTLVDQDAPSLSTSQTPQESQSSVISPVVEEQFHDIEVAILDNDLFFGVQIP
nr:hypothetical protein [Tanacetum cinerariifolium]